VRKLALIGALLRAELNAVSSLLPVMALSVLVVLGLTMGSVALAYPSFQSPPSPPTAPTATSVIPPAPSPEAPSPTTPPGETPVTSPEAPLPTEEGAPPVVPGEVTPTPEPATPAPAASPPTEEPPSRFAGLPLATLIDTFVVGFSYVWLFCGAIVLALFVLGVVLSFLVRRV
jgi:hypothetical protein